MIDRQIPQERLELLWILAYAAALLFLFRLLNLQVLGAAHYREIAEKNRTQIIAQAAPRGRIFSSDEVALATSKPSFSLIYFPGQIKTKAEIERMAKALARPLGADYEDLRNTIFKSASREKPVRLAENLPPRIMLALSELKAVYHGIDIIVEARRFYPFGPYLSHLIGYIGKMDTRDWTARSKDKNYSMDSRLGKAGLEKMYEKELKGKDGGIYLEVDSRGKLNRVLESRKWIPGADIFLTIDSKAQAAAEEGLLKSATGKGAVVALDPRTGAVLAFASAPDYDPNMFVLSGSEKEGLPAGKILPEFNVALQGSYPPGSIFKIVTGAAILESGRVRPDETFFCPGYYDAGSRVFKCWEKKGHNKVNFKDGLAKSCDVYFYNAGQRAGGLAIEKYARAFRLGQTSGIALPEEKAGNVFGPGPRAAKKSYWFVGDTLNLAIGQGETLMTPMQAAGMIAAVANGGIFHRPYYVDRIVKSDGQLFYKGEPEKISRVDLKPDTWTLIREGLHSVVLEGTGQAAKITGAEMYGKTGTAQNPQGKDHAWFVAYATVGGQPAKIAVAVLVEHGLHGASAAAPIAKAVIEAVLRADLPAKSVRPAPAAPAVPAAVPTPAGPAGQEVL
ncbi:MAG: penicillin-binding protein 2 [Elusimicrobia bacterium GWA2_61_42]|nr:MAG: penicillin-binding protein 2 [Elusimicrobia bacterium GWA2_61_42]OGR78684.1 MAG: penicillin-binding protein 2 [Elusimicrobia bacterium GWC2_61_25]